MMSVFDDMTLLELADIALEFAAGNLELEADQVEELTNLLKQRLDIYERLEELRADDAA